RSGAAPDSFQHAEAGRAVVESVEYTEVGRAFAEIVQHAEAGRPCAETGVDPGAARGMDQGDRPVRGAGIARGQTSYRLQCHPAPVEARRAERVNPPLTEQSGVHTLCSPARL